MSQEESVNNLVRPFGERIPTICLAAQLIVGLLMLVVGFLVMPYMPYFQLDRVLTPTALADDNKRTATLELLMKAGGNQRLLWTIAGSTTVVLSVLGLLSISQKFTQAEGNQGAIRTRRSPCEPHQNRARSELRSPRITQVRSDRYPANRSPLPPGGGRSRDSAPQRRQRRRISQLVTAKWLASMAQNAVQRRGCAVLRRVSAANPVLKCRSCGFSRSIRLGYGAALFLNEGSDSLVEDHAVVIGRRPDGHVQGSIP
jgi:hypothetical protein